MVNKKIKKKLFNFYLFKQNTLIQIHAIFNQKPKIFKYRPSQSEFFGFYFEDQSILGGGTVEIFSKNLFNQKLQLLIKNMHKIRQSL